MPQKDGTGRISEFEAPSEASKATNKEQSIRITSSSGLSNEEIEKMKHDAKEHAAEDKTKKESVDIRNQADSLVFQTKKQMEEMKDKLLNFSEIEIVGFGKCGVERIANKYRFEILLRAQKSTELIKAIKSCKVDLAEVDMDPIEFG